MQLENQNELNKRPKENIQKIYSSISNLIVMVIYKTQIQEKSQIIHKEVLCEDCGR